VGGVNRARESPHQGQQHLGLATILPTEHPHTLAAFIAGRITEWKAILIGRETGCLSLADRHAVDEALAADPDRLTAMGDREVVSDALKLAYRGHCYRSQAPRSTRTSTGRWRSRADRRPLPRLR
jgi:hypothetical protein